MSMKPKQKPSFFKVLIMDFTRQLRVPPAFSVKYEQSLRGGNVKLRISSGRTWDVKVEKMEGEKYRFGRGWTKFAEDVGLEMGEFVVFRLVCRSLFEVSIYGVNGCEREITVNKFENEDDGDDDDDDHNAPDVINTKQYSKAWKGYACNSLGPEKGPLYFEIHLKKHQKSRLDITKKIESVPRLHDVVIHDNAQSTAQSFMHAATKLKKGTLSEMTMVDQIITRSKVLTLQKMKLAESKSWVDYADDPEDDDQLINEFFPPDPQTSWADGAEQEDNQSAPKSNSKESLRRGFLLKKK